MDLRVESLLTQIDSLNHWIAVESKAAVSAENTLRMFVAAACAQSPDGEFRLYEKHVLATENDVELKQFHDKANRRWTFRIRESDGF